MQYMLAYMLEGSAKSHYFQISAYAARQFKLDSPVERIDPHCTIKAPFEADDETKVIEIEQILKEFTAKESPEPLTFGGYDTFNGKVVYMHVEAPKQTHMIVRRLQDKLRKVPWLRFSRNEFPVTLHATLLYPKHPQHAKEVIKNLYAFNRQHVPAELDNIALLEKSRKKWIERRRFHLGFRSV